MGRRAGRGACAITDVAINRLRYSGGRGGGAESYRWRRRISLSQWQRLPGQDSTTNDMALAAPALAVAVTGIPVSAAALAYPGGGAGASAVTPVTPVYIGNDGANGRAIFWFAPGYRVGGAVDPGFWADGLVLGLNGSRK